MAHGQHIEVVNFGHGHSCQNVGNYPEMVEGATGGLLSGTVPVICGGYATTRNQYISKSCYNLESTSPIVVMLEKRSFAASIVVGQNDSTLWITGGYNHEGISNTSEYITLTPQPATTMGPVLPIKVHGHCMVKINESMAFLNGGHGNARKTWLVDLSANSWTIGPPAIVNRRVHSCGILEDAKDGAKIIVIAGGYADWYTFKYLKTVEIWAVGDLIWRISERMPGPRGYGIGVSGLRDKDFLFVGGFDGRRYTSTIFNMECHNRKCSWTTERQELKYPRGNTVVIPLTDAAAEGCNFWK